MTVVNRVLGPLMIVFPVWPPLAIGAAIFFYVLHRKRVGPDHRIPMGLYVLMVLVCGGVASALGVFYGIKWACSIPETGNLCGLVGFLVTGPIAGTIAIVLLGLAVLRIRPPETVEAPQP